MERDPMEMALSTDIVMDVIMSHLSVRDLLSCRLASKFWNKAASSVLRKRSTITKRIEDDTDLMEFQECMKNSSDFPLAGLRIDLYGSFRPRRTMKFFKNYLEKFTRLRLDTHVVIRLHAMAPFIGYLPRLSILEVAHPLTYTSLVPVMYAVAQQKDHPKLLRLQSVRTFRICHPCPDMDEDALEEIFTAASPSLQIECQGAPPEVLWALKSTGKLGAISIINFDDNYYEDSFEFGSELPSLTELIFSNGGSLSLKGLKEILISSQDTLREMDLGGTNMGSILGPLWNKFPVFSSLNKLILNFYIDDSCIHIFRGRHGHKFPALKELILEVLWEGDQKPGPNLSDGLFIVPSVTRITIDCGYVCEDWMKQLAQSFPNVTEVRLDYRCYSGATGYDGGSNPFEIWSVREFKRLEILKICGFIVKPPSKNYINMDSFLTGIPVGICRNLHQQKQLALNLINNSPFSKGLSQVLRENPNILQLKNLKELVVCVDGEVSFTELSEDAPFMSMVSVWYALDLMPNLKAKFMYADDSTPWRNEDCGNAVLEDAFKHVKPFVKPERFSCDPNSTLQLL